MNSETRAALLVKLQALPPQRQAEVEDFVDFLITRERGDALEAFLGVADQIAKAGVPVLSASEVEEEIHAMRAERRRPNAAGS